MRTRLARFCRFSALTCCALLVCLATALPGCSGCTPRNRENSITQFGITWYFQEKHVTGQFANGDWWVVGPVTVIGIDPASTTVLGRTKNGSMLNPSPQNSYYQGFDSACGGSEYDAALNVGAGVSASRPLVLEPGSSLVSTISSAGDSRPQLSGAAVLTVLDRTPADGSFRPPYAGADKTIRYQASQLDYSLLLKLAPVQDTPDLAAVERYFERPWIDHIPGWGARDTHPADNMPDYGREMATQIGIGALMLHLDFADEEKRTLLIRYVQLGIDLYGILRDGGEHNWGADGGHASGRKWPILFAGLVLHDDGMQGISAKSGDYLYESGYGPGNPPPDYLHFGEDDQTFYVTAADVGLSAEVTSAVNGCGAATFAGHFYPPDCLEYPEYAAADIGRAEWGIVHAADPLHDGNVWSAAYRDCCTAVSWAGFVLAARFMGAHSSGLWNHPALFDYQDRYMEETAPAGANPGYRSTDAFTEHMWDAYRKDH